MKNIERAFTIHTRIEKIRTAKFVTMSINSANAAAKVQDGTLNTVLGLLAKGYINCAGKEIDPNQGLFDEETNEAVANGSNQSGRSSRSGAIRTEQEEREAEEEARRKREEEERKRLEEEERRREEERKQKEEEERLRKENSWFNRLRKKITKFGEDMVRDE